MEQIHRLQAINEAIWVRDNCGRISKELLVERIQDLAEYDIFSNRQLSKICRNKLSASLIGDYTRKSSKSGGRIAPESLEDLREALFSKERGRTDYSSVERALEAGTSQNMVSKLTGINQSAISRRFAN